MARDTGLDAVKASVGSYSLTYHCFWCELEATIFVEYEWKGHKSEAGVMALCGHHARVMGAGAGSVLCIGGRG